MIHPSTPSESTPDGQPTPPPSPDGQPTPLPDGPPVPAPDGPPVPAPDGPPVPAPDGPPASPPGGFPPPQSAGFPPPPGYPTPPPAGFPPPTGYPMPPAGFPAPPPYSPQYPGYPAGPYASALPQEPGTNGFAIASLVLGILGGVLLSAVFGILALSQIRKRPQNGRGLAIAGLALSGAWLLVILALCGGGFVAGWMEEDSASSTSTPTTGTVETDQNRVSVWGLRTGDCVLTIDDEDEIASLPIGECTEPHDGEVYATFELTPGPWPGQDRIADLADQGCDTRLRATVDEPGRDLEFTSIWPLREGWPDDHMVICIATDPDGPMTRPLKK